MAWNTARATSPGWDCHVPKPSAGISAPVLSLKRVSLAAIVNLSRDKENYIQYRKRKTD
jgi:hypothetical protein